MPKVYRMLKLITRFSVAFSCIFFTVSAQQTIVHYLSGTDKDHLVPWECMVTKGQNSGSWSTIGCYDAFLASHSSTFFFLVS